MIRFFAAWRENQRGQAAVEAVFVIPVLLFILFGIFVVGNWLYAVQVVAAATREGARVGSQTGNPRLAEMAARDALKVLDTNEEHAEVFCLAPGELGSADKPPGAAGTPFTIQIKYHIQFGFSYFQSEYEHNSSTAYPFSVATSESTARLEQDIIPEYYNTCRP